MTQNINDILESNARRTGMQVPDGYFADFAARMEQSLPERRLAVRQPLSRRQLLWARTRPYVYMAAMFCGVWLMMWIFNDIASTSTDLNDDTMFATLAGNESCYDYYVSGIDSYELLDQMYETGFDPSTLNL